MSGRFGSRQESILAKPGAVLLYLSIIVMPRKFIPVKNGSVRGRIVEQLLDAIYSGVLQPGDALPEMELASQFQVSQTPIREALFQLEQMGMVRRIPNKSSYVTKLSPTEVKERLDLRRSLEELAAIQAAGHLTEEQGAELYQRVEDIASAILKNDYRALGRTDLEFHRAVWRAARNATLFQVLDQLAAPLFAFTSVVRSNRLDDLKRVHSHQAIVSALLARDETTIREAIREHFVGSYDTFIDPEGRNSDVPSGVGAQTAAP